VWEDGGEGAIDESALAIREVLGPKHPLTLGGLQHLAAVLKAQGDLPTARSLYERALAICEKVNREGPQDARAGVDLFVRRACVLQRVTSRPTGRVFGGLGLRVELPYGW
jgi:hypothetical protein